MMLNHNTAYVILSDSGRVSPPFQIYFFQFELTTYLDVSGHCFSRRSSKMSLWEIADLAESKCTERREPMTETTISILIGVFTVYALYKNRNIIITFELWPFRVKFETTSNERNPKES